MVDVLSVKQQCWLDNICHWTQAGRDLCVCLCLHIAMRVDDLLIVGKDSSSIIKALKKQHTVGSSWSVQVPSPSILDMIGAVMTIVTCAALHFYNPFTLIVIGNLRKMVINAVLLANRLRRSQTTTTTLLGPIQKMTIGPLSKAITMSLTHRNCLMTETFRSTNPLLDLIIGKFDMLQLSSRFRVCPCQWHLGQAKHGIEYLSKFKHGIIHIHMEKPDHSGIPKRCLTGFTCDMLVHIPENVPSRCGDCHKVALGC